MFRRFLLVVAITVVAGACAPRLAQASCGDWLQHPQTSDPGQDTAAPLELPFDSRPCSGPNCQQAPLGPVPSGPAPVSERHHHEIACLLGEPCFLRSIDARLGAEQRPDLLSGMPLTIDRPPKS